MLLQLLLIHVFYDGKLVHMVTLLFQLCHIPYPGDTGKEVGLSYQDVDIVLPSLKAEGSEAVDHDVPVVHQVVGQFPHEGGGDYRHLSLRNTQDKSYPAIQVPLGFACPDLT